MDTNEMEKGAHLALKPLDTAELDELDALLDQVPRATSDPPALVRPWFSRLIDWARKTSSEK